MERTPSSTTGKSELAEYIAEQTKQKALEEAGKNEMRVSKVSGVQKQMVQNLLADNEGSEESRTLILEVNQKIERQHAERMQSIQAAPDARVFERTDSMAAVQDDNTREIGIADDILADADAAERAAIHEAKHREQEEGMQTFSYIDENDKQSEVRRLPFREDESIEAEGGLKDHTPEYHDYVAHTKEVAEKLNAAGENGHALTREAARSVKGFEKVRQKLIEHSIRTRMEKELALGA
ncbi:MAG: hypothetical protein ABL890_01645 [Candidatus Peribacteraceae bacterium]